jgi:hypothetical protein
MIMMVLPVDSARGPPGAGGPSGSLWATGTGTWHARGRGRCPLSDRQAQPDWIGGGSESTRRQTMQTHSCGSMPAEAIRRT